MPVALAFALAGCDTLRGVTPAADQPPTVTITSGPIDTVSAPSSWLVDIAWVGNDPDGRVDHYEYAIDPPTLSRARRAMAETSWVKTQEHHVVARFRATRPDSLVPGATASDFHVFVLRAVDDRGVHSANAVRAFYAYTVAPDVKITRPLPSEFVQASVPIPFRVDWTGDDPDGAGSRRPVAYRTRLIVMKDIGDLVYLSDPDSLWREGARSGWAGWRTVPAESTSQVIAADQVALGQLAAFAVLAVDEAGATTPYLDLDRNFLQFVGAFSEALAPRIHIYSSLVDFTYESGGWSVDPLREIPVQSGANAPIRFDWDGLPSPGGRLTASRWMLDGDPHDETPRGGSDDLTHWSALLPAASGTSLPPLAVGTHRLYVELRDDFDARSLGIVRIDAIDFVPAADLLVVDDTRLEADQILAGSLQPYRAPWPSAAELDTFLYARGGVPWRGARNPSGATSAPGLLAGYAFDTLGTRLGLEDPAQAAPLTTLARYRHVLWLVDPQSARIPFIDVTALAASCQPGLASALSAYVSMGGQAWLAGGGAAYASLIAFNRRSNDTCGTLFTADRDELGPGRPLYDFAHVRSSLMASASDAQPVRSAAARGGWSGQGPDGTLSAPDYSKLPASLRFRTPGSDPLPPTRLASQSALYYLASAGDEYVSAPNAIAERLDPLRFESTLDTLYDVASPLLCASPAPAMIYYHGRDNAPFVFTGFDLWSWTRTDCQGLVDFVLGDIWKLPKSAPGVRAAAPSSRVQRPAPSRVSARLDPRRMRP